MSTILPEGTRHAPIDMDPDAFAAAGHRLVDDVAGLLASMGTRRLAPVEGVAEIREALGADRGLPESGMDASDLLRDAVETLVAALLARRSGGLTRG